MAIVHFKQCFCPMLSNALFTQYTVDSLIKNIIETPNREHEVFKKLKISLSLSVC